jgi:hypothetical protein
VVSVLPPTAGAGLPVEGPHEAPGSATGTAGLDEREPGVSASKKSHRYKGCCLMCAAWIRGDGMAKRLRAADRRRLGGRNRRISRHRVSA